MARYPVGVRASPCKDRPDVHDPVGTRLRPLVPCRVVLSRLNGDLLKLEVTRKRPLRVRETRRLIAAYYGCACEDVFLYRLDDSWTDPDPEWTALCLKNEREERLAALEAERQRCLRELEPKGGAFGGALDRTARPGEGAREAREANLARAEVLRRKMTRLEAEINQERERVVDVSPNRCVETEMVDVMVRGDTTMLKALKKRARVFALLF